MILNSQENLTDEVESLGRSENLPNDQSNPNKQESSIPWWHVFCDFFIFLLHIASIYFYVRLGIWLFSVLPR